MGALGGILGVVGGPMGMAINVGLQVLQQVAQQQQQQGQECGEGGQGSQNDPARSSPKSSSRWRKANPACPPDWHEDGKSAAGESGLACFSAMRQTVGRNRFIAPWVGVFPDIER